MIRIVVRSEPLLNHPLSTLTTFVIHLWLLGSEGLAEVLQRSGSASFKHRDYHTYCIMLWFVEGSTSPSVDCVVAHGGSGGPLGSRGPMRVQGGHWGSGVTWGFRGPMGAQGSHTYHYCVVYLSIVLKYEEHQPIRVGVLLREAQLVTQFTVRLASLYLWTSLRAQIVLQFL